jgi:hypothetical protein
MRTRSNLQKDSRVIEFRYAIDISIGEKFPMTCVASVPPFLRGKPSKVPL